MNPAKAAPNSTPDCAKQPTSKPARVRMSPSGAALGSPAQRARMNPQTLTPRDVLQLQRTIGNRAVAKLLGRNKPVIQPTTAGITPLDIAAERQSASNSAIQRQKNFDEFLNHQGEHNALVYGTENARGTYRKELEGKLPSGFKKEDKQPIGYATTGYYTVDRYNNYSWRDFDYAGEANFSIFNPEYVKTLEGINKQAKIREDLMKYTDNIVKEDVDKQYVRKYLEDLLAHPTYSPLETFRQYENECNKLVKGGKTPETARLDVAKQMFELQTRRASKFGLEYMARKEGGGVAFIREVGEKFGEIPSNSDFVLSKKTSTNRPGGRPGTARVPITVSEERKAFRERHALGDKLKFFKGGENIEAPWDKVSGNKENSKKWDSYEYKRFLKYAELAKKLDIDLDDREHLVKKALEEKNLNLRINNREHLVKKVLKERYLNLHISEAIRTLKDRVRKALKKKHPNLHISEAIKIEQLKSKL